MTEIYNSQKNPFHSKFSPAKECDQCTSSDLWCGDVAAFASCDARRHLLGLHFCKGSLDAKNANFSRGGLFVEMMMGDVNHL